MIDGLVEEGSPPRLPASHFNLTSMSSATLHGFVYFQVDTGVWYFLYYVEDIISAWSPSSFLLKPYLAFNQEQYLHL